MSNVQPVQSTSTSIPSVIQWDGVSTLGLTEFRLVVPIHTVGRVHIYKVPISTDYPEGYWVSLNTSTNPFEVHEPPMSQTEFMHLCTIMYNGTMNGEMISATIISCHPSIRPYAHLLNPGMKV